MTVSPCPECGHKYSNTIDSRPPVTPEESWWFRRRRRECPKCEHRFTTYEILADDLERLRTASCVTELARIIKIMDEMQAIIEKGKQRRAKGTLWEKH